MTGSEEYQIKRWTKFETSFAKLIKAHYRKNLHARAAFEELVSGFIERLAIDPCADSDAASFPGRSAESRFEFRKKRWQRLPGLQGAARFGRLLYLIYHPQRLVYPCWIYTHAEYGEPKNQPPAKELEREIHLIKQEIASPPSDSSELNEED